MERPTSRPAAKSGSSPGAEIATGETAEPAKLCRYKHDSGWAPQQYDALGIKHDNYATCDAMHKHTFSCQQNHTAHVMPVLWLLIEGWIILGVAMWLARTKNPKGIA